MVSKDSISLNDNEEVLLLLQIINYFSIMPRGPGEDSFSTQLHRKTLEETAASGAAFSVSVFRPDFILTNV